MHETPRTDLGKCATEIGGSSPTRVGVMGAADADHTSSTDLRKARNLPSHYRLPLRLLYFHCAPAESDRPGRAQADMVGRLIAGLGPCGDGEGQVYAEVFECGRLREQPVE